MDKKVELKILYVTGVGVFGGSSRSLYEVLHPLVEKSLVRPHFISVSGDSIEFFRRLSGDIYVTLWLVKVSPYEYQSLQGASLARSSARAPLCP